MRILKQSHSAEKCKRGDPRVLKFSKSLSAKKIKGGPFSRFCDCTRKFLAEAGTQTRDRWVPPKVIQVCTKNWYIQGELCGLTKKILFIIFRPHEWGRKIMICVAFFFTNSVKSQLLFTPFSKMID